MSPDAILLIVYILLALGVSFLCSVAEAVLLSIAPAYIEGLRTTRPRRAQRLKRLRQDNVDQSLAAILTLNTIAHTVGAIGAGVQAEHVFGSAWIGLFSAVMTLAILFLSEIVPKTLGTLYWARLSWPVALFVQGLIYGLYPFVWISERLTRLLARNKPIHTVSREELMAMTRVGEKAGTLQQSESRFIKNLFTFSTLRVRDIMTPRTVVSMLPADITVQEAAEEMTQSPFSRLPLYESDPDNIVGFVLRDDILRLHATGHDAQLLRDLRRDLVVVPEIVSLPQLMERLLKERQQIAQVVDEYGDTQGVVSLEDLIETLLGFEIVDEMDSEDDMQAFARELWAARSKTIGVGEKEKQEG